MKLTLLTFGLFALTKAQNSTSASSSAASSSATSSGTAAPASSSAASSGVLVDTSILTVPSLTGVAYSTATASSLAQYLPSYQYNLTSEPLRTRQAICNQTTQFCASAKCTDPTGNVTSNFCNPTTMGWNCQCDKGTSRLQPVTVPVNTYDCQFRAQACLTACQNRNASVPVNSIPNCQAACNYVIGSTCGTSSQIIPEYQVKSYNDTPKYYPDTTKGGVAAGITTPAGASALTISGLAVTVSILLGAVVLVSH